MLTRRRASVVLVAAPIIVLLGVRRARSVEAPRAAAAPSPAPPGPAPGEGSSVLPEVEDVSVGSAEVLQALWSGEQLRSHAGEARLRRQRPPDRSPPADLAMPLRSPLPPSLRGSIRGIKPTGGAKVVALTFDLCERADGIAGYDGAIVDTLRAAGVRATFFAGGKWLRSHPERGQQLIADPLFEVGNHGWTHGNMRVLAGERAEQQILWTQAQYGLLRRQLAERAERAGLPARVIASIPPAPLAFRFPYGTCSAETLAMTANFGLAAIQWSVISADAVAGEAPATVERSVLEAVRPGSIVVFHANGRGYGTAAALPAIVRTLKERGYRFVTISTLLKAGDPIASDTCYELRPGDNQRYDKLFGEGTG